jgi:hypothetical protein
MRIQNTGKGVIFYFVFNIFIFVLFCLDLSESFTDVCVTVPSFYTLVAYAISLTLGITLVGVRAYRRRGRTRDVSEMEDITSTAPPYPTQECYFT